MADRLRGEPSAMGIRVWTFRDLLTGVLAILAIIIVFVTAGGYAPAAWLPRAPPVVIEAIPHVNILLSLASLVTIAYGWRAIRMGKIAQHQRAMLTAAGLFLAFLVLYLYRLTVLGGPADFEGARMIYRFVYLPVLTVHIGLAIVCIPLVFDALALGLTVSPGDLRRTRHPRVGRLAATLWILTYSFGIAVYFLLYWL